MNRIEKVYNEVVLKNEGLKKYKNHFKNYIIEFNNEIERASILTPEETKTKALEVIAKHYINKMHSNFKIKQIYNNAVKVRVTIHSLAAGVYEEEKVLYFNQ